MDATEERARGPEAAVSHEDSTVRSEEHYSYLELLCQPLRYGSSAHAQTFSVGYLSTESTLSHCPGLGMGERKLPELGYMCQLYSLAQPWLLCVPCVNRDNNSTYFLKMFGCLNAVLNVDPLTGAPFMRSHSQKLLLSIRWWSKVGNAGLGFIRRVYVFLRTLFFQS